MTELNAKYGQGNPATQRCCPEYGWKPIDQFASDGYKTMRLLRFCRRCDLARNKKSKIKNMTEEKRASLLAKARDKWRNRTEEEREHDREQHRLWCEKNSGSNYARKERWVKANPDKAQFVLKKVLTEHYTGKQWRELCARYENRCLCCGATDRPLTADHIVPLSKGESNSIDNIQPLCKKCNCIKHTKTIDYRP